MLADRVGGQRTGQPQGGEHRGTWKVASTQEELKQRCPAPPATVRKEAGSRLFEVASGQNKDVCVKADYKLHQLELQKGFQASLLKGVPQ